MEIDSHTANVVSQLGGERCAKQSDVGVASVKPKKFSDVTAVGVQIERVAPRQEDPPSRGAAVLRLIGSGMVPGGS